MNASWASFEERFRVPGSSPASRRLYRLLLGKGISFLRRVAAALRGGGRGGLGYQPEGDWERAPRLIEDTYDLTDAVVVGNLLISLLRHADRVRMACLAQLVNAIGAIRSEPGGPSWRQTIFHPFALTSRYGRGTVLQTPVSAPGYETPQFGLVPKADAVAVLSDSGDELTVFAVNRDQHEPLPVTIDVHSLPALRVAHHTYIGDDKPSAANTQDAPDRVVPRAGPEMRVDDGVLEMVLPALSWNMLRIGGNGQ